MKLDEILAKLHTDETPHDLFSSLPVRYSTMLNVVKHARGEAYEKLHI